MLRVRHSKYGFGLVLAEFVSGGGQKVATVIFDARPEEERTILLSCLSESKEPMPDAAKAKPKARMKKEKPAPIPDRLLCPELDETISGKFDLTGLDAADSPESVQEAL